MKVKVQVLALCSALFGFSQMSVSAAEPAPPPTHEHKSHVGAPVCEEKPDGHAKVHCVDPFACCAESEKVIETLQTLTKAYIHGDIKTIEEHLDDNCTTFCEDTGKLVTGKVNVIADLKGKLEKLSPTGETPLLSFTIDQPYAKVNGDTAVVTFVAYREIGGKHPLKQKSHITDIFVKHNGVWKKLHYRGAWKKIS